MPFTIAFRLLQMNSETDFVSRGDSFRNLARKIAIVSTSADLPSNRIDAVSLDSVNKLVVQDEPDEPNQQAAQLPVPEAITRMMSKLRENILTLNYPFSLYVYYGIQTKQTFT